MKYTFNTHVTFDVAERKLSSEVAEFVLTNPACRLLLVLIENNGELVEKESLLIKVWEEFGLVPSEGSLHNNISLLRKGLVHVGITNALETVPKKGFMLTLESIDLDIVTPDQIQFNKLTTPSPSYVKKRWYWSKWKNYALFLISTILVLTIFALFSHNYISKKSQHYRYFGNVDKCAIYYFDDIKVERVSTFFSNGRGLDILKFCTKSALVYYDDDKTSLYNNNKTSSIVSFCDLEGGNVHECKNFVNIAVN